MIISVTHFTNTEHRDVEMTLRCQPKWPAIDRRHTTYTISKTRPATQHMWLALALNVNSPSSWWWQHQQVKR